MAGPGTLAIFCHLFLQFKFLIPFIIIQSINSFLIFMESISNYVKNCFTLTHYSFFIPPCWLVAKKQAPMMAGCLFVLLLSSSLNIIHIITINSFHILLK